MMRRSPWPRSTARASATPSSKPSTVNVHRRPLSTGARAPPVVAAAVAAAEAGEPRSRVSVRTMCPAKAAASTSCAGKNSVSPPISQGSLGATTGPTVSFQACLARAKFRSERSNFNCMASGVSPRPPPSTGRSATSDSRCAQRASSETSRFRTSLQHNSPAVIGNAPWLPFPFLASAADPLPPIFSIAWQNSAKDTLPSLDTSMAAQRSSKESESSWEVSE
mmetsp:Transcript_150472/g.483648  ORF Transcript_150472/g.483648 Transcript_150472/m.483648 type:complete len:222 (-) Transcript_150472:2505-3170(-)